MPELPEVETVARGLRQAILGRRILSVTLGKTDFIDDPAALEQHLPGRQIEAVERYGKFMLLRLSAVNQETRAATNGDAAPASLLVHLGMTGQIAPIPARLPLEKHTHVCLLLDDGRELRYTDARRFGRIAYLTKTSLAEELAGFGADPLEVSKEEFANRICERRARIKALLLDQSVLRGVGNIYADESLWRARIHPARLGTKLGGKDAETLRRALQEILRKAIVLRGSSISGRAGRISAAPSGVRARGEKVLSLQNGDPPRDCGGPKQLFLSQMSAFTAQFCCAAVTWEKQEKG